METLQGVMEETIGADAEPKAVLEGNKKKSSENETDKDGGFLDCCKNYEKGPTEQEVFRNQDRVIIEFAVDENQSVRDNAEPKAQKGLGSPEESHGGMW